MSLPLWDPPLFSEMGLNNQYDSVGESLKLFADDPLAFPPDSSFQYGTYGYTLLSAAVEAAAAEPFLDYMRSALFEPLSMQHGGTAIGAQCALLLVPESSIAVAICANSHTGSSGELMPRLRSRFLSWPMTKPTSLAFDNVKT